MKKIFGYFLVLLGSFGLGALVQGIKIRRLKKKLKVIHTEEAKALEMVAREKQILAMYEKVKAKEDEIKKYEQLAVEISKIAEGDDDYQERLDAVLTKFMDDNNIPNPWGNRDFDEFMRDPDATLYFG